MTNGSDRKIYVLSCSGFGQSSPDVGVLSPGVEADMFFPPLASFPNVTTIKWRDETDGVEHEDEVNLAGLIQPGVQGMTEFVFSNEKKWSVTFHPNAKR